MATFRGFWKLRAVVPELGILKGSCIPKARVPGKRSIQQYASVLSVNNSSHQRRRIPDSHLSAVAAPHSVVGNDAYTLACWGLSKRSLHVNSCLTSSNSSSKQSESTDDAWKTEKDVVDEDLSNRDATDEKRPNDAEKDDDDDEDDPLVAKYDETGKPLSNWARMKMMMKAYGYVIIPVHWVIAPVWFGAFYYTIKMGVDIAPFLLKIGISDHHVNTLSNSGASNALMAYALYKIFTPLRYTVTLGATEMTIRYLRRKGYIKHAPRKEKTYRESLKETVKGVKEKIENR